MRQNQHPLYSRWRFWQQVCHNENNPSYKYVGGKGVQIEFTSFWDMAKYVDEQLGPPPLGSSSRLARINLKGNYAPGNLRWETGSELVSRSDHAVILTHQGRTQCLSAWADECGINRATLFNRIKKWNWTLDEALNPSLHKRIKA